MLGGHNNIQLSVPYLDPRLLIQGVSATNNRRRPVRAGIEYLGALYTEGTFEDMYIDDIVSVLPPGRMVDVNEVGDTTSGQ